MAPGHRLTLSPDSSERAIALDGCRVRASIPPPQRSRVTPVPPASVCDLGFYLSARAMLPLRVKVLGLRWSCPGTHLYLPSCFPTVASPSIFCRWAFRQRRKEAVPRPRNSSSTLARELKGAGSRRHGQYQSARHRARKHLSVPEAGH